MAKLSFWQKFLKSISCGLINPNPRSAGGLVQNKHVQILVIGDAKVGKSTLINNYVSDSGTQEVEMAKHSELIRIVNANSVIQNPSNPDEHTNINVTCVDVEGSINNVNKQIRDGYYTTSQIIIILYNVANVISLYNTVKQWQTEIKEACHRFNKEESDKVQLYLVGVNPEARDKAEIFKDDEFIHDVNADEFQVDLFRRNSQRKSVNHTTAQNLARRLSVGKSTKTATHREVKTSKADIKRFFSDVISNYVYPDDS